MLDIQALFKISYGLYIVSSGDKTRGNGFISNTVLQVAVEPAKFKDLPDVWVCPMCGSEKSDFMEIQ
jgi:hypothetical protein